MPTDNSRIVFCGGGTGGHLMPIVAIVRVLKQRNTPLEIHYIGARAQEAELLRREGCVTHLISAGKIRRYFSWQNISDMLWNIPRGFWQSFALLRRMKPDLVFSKGGTGSLPVAWAAKQLGIPLLVHESDAVPGLANRKAIAWAQKAFASFPGAPGVLTGNPIRQELLAGSREAARAMFSLAGRKPVLLIIGGSQGSQAINHCVATLLDELLTQYEVIHVTGPENDAPAQPGYHAYRSLSQQQMAAAYAAADVIVSRAGSSSIFEIAASGTPSVLIPLPSSAQNHQMENARQYAAAGAAVIVEQNNLAKPSLFAAMRRAREEAEAMRAAALGFAKPNAAADVAGQIIAYLHEHEKA